MLVLWSMWNPQQFLVISQSCQAGHHESPYKVTTATRKAAPQEVLLSWRNVGSCQQTPETHRPLLYCTPPIPCMGKQHVLSSLIISIACGQSGSASLPGGDRVLLVLYLLSENHCVSASHLEMFRWGNAQLLGPVPFSRVQFSSERPRQAVFPWWVTRGSCVTITRSRNTHS